MCIYVDDLLIIGSKIIEIEKFKGALIMEFEMTNLGRLRYFSRMEFVEIEKGIILHQHVTEILKNFRMDKCNPAAIPVEVKVSECAHGKEEVDSTSFKQMVGSLRYL